MRSHCLLAIEVPEPFFGVAHHPSLARRTPVRVAILLIGRYAYGWRGRTALRFTLTGFVMLLLAYVGSRFVLEVILGRA